MDNQYYFVDDTPDRVYYALMQMLYRRNGMTQSLVNYLSKNYFDRYGVIDFANFFCTYWEASGQILFDRNHPKDKMSDEQRNQFYLELIDRKYLAWLELMDYKAYEKILDDDLAENKRLGY